MIRLWLLGALLGVGILGCNEDSSSSPPQIETSLVLEDQAGLPRTSFNVGETITLVFTVKNANPFPIGLALPTFQTFDFFVSSATQSWQWSLAQSFDPIQTTLQFEPNEAKTFTVVWNQKDNSGQPFAPGSCSASAVVPTASPLGSPAVLFTLT